MSAEPATSLFDTADLAFKRGQWKIATAAFAGIARACPDHFKTRFRIADCLLNLGRRDLALDVYKSLAWHAIKSGQPLLGLVAVKMVILLEPAYEDILLVLAETYSTQSDRVSRDAELLSYPDLTDSPADPLDPDADDLVEQAAKLATVDETGGYPDEFPTIPLFSYLDEDAFIEVLGKLKLRRYADDEVIIRQGSQGESFFMIADGDVLIKRDIEEEDGGVTLAHLHRGAVFGELALISDEPRHASVVARGDVDVLEMRRSDLVVAASQLEGVTKAMKLFTRERFLGNLTATHPFFTSLSKAERHKVMDLFRAVEAQDGEVLIGEGEAGPGLFLILGGEASVAKKAGEDRVHLATLRGGSLCGEMSLVHDQPTSATVTAEGKVEALFLSRDDFNQVVKDHPEILAYLAGVNDERLRQNRALFHSKGLLEDDEYIMV